MKVFSREGCLGVPVRQFGDGHSVCSICRRSKLSAAARKIVGDLQRDDVFLAVTDMWFSCPDEECCKLYFGINGRFGTHDYHVETGRCIGRSLLVAWHSVDIFSLIPAYGVGFGLFFRYRRPSKSSLICSLIRSRSTFVLQRHNRTRGFVDIRYALTLVMAYLAIPADVLRLQFSAEMVVPDYPVSSLHFGNIENGMLSDVQPFSAMS